MKKIFTFIAMVLAAAGVYAAELTVADGTATSEKMPIRGYYGDCFTHNQVIYPAAYIQDLKGASLTSMTFYVSSQASAAQTPVYTVSLAIVSADKFTSDAYGSSYYFLTDETVKVYEGTMDASQATVTVTFDTPFAYNGGNLLLDIQTKTRGNDKDSEFFGLSTSSVLSVFANGFGGGQPGTSGSGESFLPKTTFAYTGEVSAPCVKPANLKADSVAPDYAAVSWTAGGEETQWQAVCMAGNAAADWSGAVLVNEPKAAFANLQPTSDYTIYVRSYCAEDKQSFDESVAVHTACGIVTELPWSEDFSNADALACWELQNANVRIFSGALMFGLNGADSLVAAMPEFDAAYDTLALTFNYNTNSYNATLELGYISAEDAFVALGDAYPKTKNYTLVEDVLLNTVPAAAKRLAFRYAATEASYVYVDNITLKVAPEEVVTGIEQTEAGVKAVKRIENGQLVIIKNGVRFNVLGSAL